MNKQRDNVTRCMLVFWLVASFSVVIKGCDSNITRHDLERNVVIVCCSVTCPEEYQVVKCQVNGTADTCELCPPGTFMDDTTDSHDPFPCSEFNCPPESIPALNYPESGCRHKKCVCDAGRGFVGPDPCACQQSRLVCPEGSALTIHNNCTVKDPSTNSNVGTTIPRKISTVYVVNTITEGLRSEVTESITTVKPDVSKPIWFWVFVGAAVLAVLGAFGACKYKKQLCRNDERNGVEDVPMTNISNGERTYMCVDHENGIPSTYLNSNGVPSASVSNSLPDTNQGNGVEDVPMTNISNGERTYMCVDHENGIPSTYLNSNGVPSASVSNSLPDTNQGTIALAPAPSLQCGSMDNDNQSSIALSQAPLLDSLLKEAVQ